MSNDSLFDYLEDKERERFEKIKSNEWKWWFKDYPKETNGIKVFSCFAGGGGSTMGYKLAGCEVLGCLELDPFMNKVYMENHNPKYNFNMDIRDFNKIQDKELPDELFHLDILDGSPPCTAFSASGKREETWGKAKKYREGLAEQTLDDLPFVFIETIKKLKPKVVIMENVEGLLLGDAYDYVRRIYKGFHDVGYKVCHFLLKGEDMGVPQRRNRVFFIATNHEVEKEPSSCVFSYNYEHIPYRQIKEGKIKKIEMDHRWYKTIMQAIPKDKRLGDTKERVYGIRSGFNVNYFRDNEVVQTIRTRLDAIDIEKCGFVGWEVYRNAMTFPQDYNFMGAPKTKRAYVCGMAVPPLMIKRIVTSMIEQGMFDYKLEMGQENVAND